jgi:tetratricopeptide (TPR) repeat protein
MYRSVKQDRWYCIHKEDAPVMTPMNAPVITSSQSLAERLVSDLEEFGEVPSNPESIVAFHYALIDFFLNAPRDENEYLIAKGLDKENEWTFSCPAAGHDCMMKWWAVFGQPMSAEQQEETKKWLSSLTMMQLCAVSVISRYTGSVNIAYRLATIVDRSNIGQYARDIVAFYPYLRVKTLYQAFDNFIFYFTLEGEAQPQRTQEPEHTSVTHPSLNNHLAVVADLYRSHGPESPEYAICLNKLAALYLAQGHYGKAERTYEHAVTIMENALGSEHPDIAPILDDMSLFYRKMGRTLDAKRVNERAMAIRARKR